MVPQFYPPLPTYERRPPAAVTEGPGHLSLVQVFQVGLLEGADIPAWGVTKAVANEGQVTSDGPGGSLVSDTNLQQGAVYAVRSEVSDPTPGQLAAASVDASDATDLQLPQPVPNQLVNLAHSLVAGATTAYQKALDLQDYLTSDIFQYRLPKATSLGGVAAPAPGYADLLSFLFKTRTGYCQQFATSFAVLARIDGLPTLCRRRVPPRGVDRPRLLGGARHRYPRLAPGKVRRLRLDRLRAHTRRDDQRLEQSGQADQAAPWRRGRPWGRPRTTSTRPHSWGPAGRRRPSLVTLGPAR